MNAFSNVPPQQAVLTTMRSVMAIYLKIGILGLCALLALLPRLIAAPSEKVDFNFQIRPLLSDLLPMLWAGREVK